MSDEYDDNKPGEQGSVAEDFILHTPTPKYRFLDEPDEKGKPQHLHQLWNERKEEWENLTGATTILDVLGKVLTWWAAELSAVECLEAGEKIPTIRKEYLLAANSPDKKKAIDALQVKYPIFKKARFAHTVRLNEAADAGTDLHAELEKYVKWHMAFNGRSDKERTKAFNPKPWSDRVLQFAMWADKKVKRFIWSEAHCYDELLFVGGITDVGAEMKDGSFAIIDFKSAKEAYFNHFVQEAIYDLLVERNGLVDKYGNGLFMLGRQNMVPFTKYIVIPFGASKFTVSENTNIKGLKKAAVACIDLYRQKSAFENQ